MSNVAQLPARGEVAGLRLDLRLSIDVVSIGEEAADLHGGVGVGTIETGWIETLEDDPGDAQRDEKVQALGIGLGAEAGLGGNSADPRCGQGGGDGGLASVFRIVGEDAALRDGTESLGVFSGDADVVGVDGEEGVSRGAAADPEKCLDPGVCWRKSGQFEVQRGWIDLPLSVQHDAAQQKCCADPTECASLQESPAEKGAETEDHDDVDELKDA